MRALGLNPGDEVIAPAFTFFATAGAIHNAGGRPVFADIEPGTFNVDPAAVEAAITPRTRAIVLVHLFGQMADVGAFAAMAKKHDLMLVEDAAQSIGARRQGERGVEDGGRAGHGRAPSFFPTKNLGAWGDGGMMVAQDDTLADGSAGSRLHGGAREYFHDEVGLNSRLDSIQAAVLLAKLPYLAAWRERRQEIAAAYTAGVYRTSAGVTPPPVDPANEHIFHQYTIRAERRETLLAHLKSRGIWATRCTTRWRFICSPVSRTWASAAARSRLTERATDSVVSLPIYPELTSARIDAVIAAVREFYQRMAHDHRAGTDRQGRAPRGALRHRRTRLRRPAACVVELARAGYKVLGFDIIPRWSTA